MSALRALKNNMSYSAESLVSKTSTARYKLDEDSELGKTGLTQLVT